MKVWSWNPPAIYRLRPASTAPAGWKPQYPQWCQPETETCRRTTVEFQQISHPTVLHEAPLRRSRSLPASIPATTSLRAFFSGNIKRSNAHFSSRIFAYQSKYYWVQCIVHTGISLNLFKTMRSCIARVIFSRYYYTSFERRFGAAGQQSSLQESSRQPIWPVFALAFQDPIYLGKPDQLMSLATICQSSIKVTGGCWGSDGQMQKSRTCCRILLNYRGDKRFIWMVYI